METAIQRTKQAFLGVPWWDKKLERLFFLIALLTVTLANAVEWQWNLSDCNKGPNMMAFHFHEKKQAVWVRNGGIKDSNLLEKKKHFRTAIRLNSNSLNTCRVSAFERSAPEGVLLISKNNWVISPLSLHLLKEKDGLLLLRTDFHLHAFLCLHSAHHVMLWSNVRAVVEDSTLQFYLYKKFQVLFIKGKHHKGVGELSVLGYFYFSPCLI